jgi:hypothetical protein
MFRFIERYTRLTLVYDSIFEELTIQHRSHLLKSSVQSRYCQFAITTLVKRLRPNLNLTSTKPQPNLNLTAT